MIPNSLQRLHVSYHWIDGYPFYFQPPDCSSGRRKRQADEGSPATIEVYSGLYVNEANDLARPDQLDLVERQQVIKSRL